MMTEWPGSHLSLHNDPKSTSPALRTDDVKLVLEVADMNSPGTIFAILHIWGIGASRTNFMRLSLIMKCSLRLNDRPVLSEILSRTDGQLADPFTMS